MKCIRCGKELSEQEVYFAKEGEQKGYCSSCIPYIYIQYDIPEFQQQYVRGLLGFLPKEKREENLVWILNQSTDGLKLKKKQDIQKIVFGKLLDSGVEKEEAESIASKVSSFLHKK